MKNSFKKALVAVLITACGVWALDGVPYIDENGITRISPLFAQANISL